MIIQLSRGLQAIVDDSDFESLNIFKWHAHSDGYAVRNAYVNNKRTTIRMHRELLQCPAGLDVDHVNGNRLDNRRENLRICKRVSNTYNRPKNRNNTTGYKGVCNLKGTWRAEVVANGTRHYLGTFPTAEAAARAYDAKAIELHGDFAKLNFELSNTTGESK